MMGRFMGIRFDYVDIGMGQGAWGKEQRAGSREQGAENPDRHAT
jgi:hypothetical protein